MTTVMNVPNENWKTHIKFLKLLKQLLLRNPAILNLTSILMISAVLHGAHYTEEVSCALRGIGVTLISTG